MKVTDLKKVTEIDASLTMIHQEVERLYHERARIMHHEDMLPAAEPRTPQAIKPVMQVIDEAQQGWAKSTHAKLERAWAKHGITIPKYDVFSERYKKAYGIVQDLEKAMPELKGAMEVVVVPPKRDLKLPLDNKVRELDETLFDADEVIKKVKKSRSQKNWSVLLVYAYDNGLYMGVPATIIEDGLYMINGYDARSLGVAEYAALVVSQDKPLDVGTNTMLLKDMSPTSAIPYASYEHEKTTFKVDVFGFGGVFGDDRFRPAVEVK